MKKKMKKINQPCKRDKYENSTGNSTDIWVNSTGVLLDTVPDAVPDAVRTPVRTQYGDSTVIFRLVLFPPL